MVRALWQLNDTTRVLWTEVMPLLPLVRWHFFTLKLHLLIC